MYISATITFEYFEFCFGQHWKNQGFIFYSYTWYNYGNTELEFTVLEFKLV